MQKTFLKRLLPGLGYALMGNFMSAIMSLSVGLLRSSTELMLIAALFSLTIYLTLTAVPAYKDAFESAKKHPVNRQGEDSKSQLLHWLAIGAVAWALMSVVPILHLLNLTDDFTLRLVSGAVAPLGWILIEGTGEFVTVNGEESEIMRLLPWAPLVFTGLYSLSIPANWLGWRKGIKSGV
jgi:uncharacterized membrane protein